MNKYLLIGVVILYLIGFVSAYSFQPEETVAIDYLKSFSNPNDVFDLIFRRAFDFDGLESIDFGHRLLRGSWWIVNPIGEVNSPIATEQYCNSLINKHVKKEKDCLKNSQDFIHYKRCMR